MYVVLFCVLFEDGFCMVSCFFIVVFLVVFRVDLYLCASILGWRIFFCCFLEKKIVDSFVLIKDCRIFAPDKGLAA